MSRETIIARARDLIRPGASATTEQLGAAIRDLLTLVGASASDGAEAAVATATLYRHTITGETVSMTPVQAARFFDNRSPMEWDEVSSASSTEDLARQSGGVTDLLGSWLDGHGADPFNWVDYALVAVIVLLTFAGIVFAMGPTP